MEAAAATPALAEARETVIALTRQAGKVQQECGLDILPDEFARGVLKWGLMEVWLFRIKEPLDQCPLDSVKAVPVPLGDQSDGRLIQLPLCHFAAC